MRLHLTALPHTSTTSYWSTCAYTQKAKRFCTMMTDLGHEVYLYGGVSNEARVTEHIPVVRPEESVTWWPNWDPQEDVWDGFDPAAKWWTVTNARAIQQIRKRIQPGDLIGLIAGHCQRPVADAFPDHVSMEWGVGYEGITTPFRCFESYNWMSHVYGLNGIRDGQFFDAVIPNSYEPGEFVPVEDPDNDYLLYMGRMTPRKGLPILEEIAKDYGLITAGQGQARVPGAVHVGTVRGNDRLELLQHAKAVIVPTTYIEPFGGVAVEAMLCGTPVITTDWGAFPELVTNGVNGFRCRMLTDFLCAIDEIGKLDRQEVAQIAAVQWTTPVVAPRYERWLENLTSLYGIGWDDRDWRGDPWG